jgi:hypothetical protein
MKYVIRVNAEIPVPYRDHVVSMLSAMSRNTGNNVFVLKISLAIQKLNALESHQHATAHLTAHSLCSVQMEYACLHVPRMRTVQSMRDVFKGFAC